MQKLFTRFLIVLFLLSLHIIFAQAPTSVGLAPEQTFVPWSYPSDWNFPSRTWITIVGANQQLNKGSTANTIIIPVGSPYTSLPGANSYNVCTEKLWINYQAAPYTLSTQDTTTGVLTTVCTPTGVPFTSFTGISWNKQGTKLWGVCTDNSKSAVFTINTTSGVCTPVGAPTATCAGAISISCSPDGWLFVVDIVADKLYKFNPATGACALIGPLGIDANYAQDAQFDLGNGALYWGCYDNLFGGPCLRKIDTLTAASTLIGGYSGQVGGIGIKIYYYGITNDKTDTNVEVYPNPANAIVNIVAANIESIKVLNPAGQLLENIIVNSNSTHIDVSSYAAGVYIIQLKTSNGFYTKKITVNK